MPELKKLFFKEFLDADWKTRQVVALLSIVFRNETVKDFMNRFSNLMRGTDFAWEGTSSYHGFLKHVLFYKCPNSVQRLLNGKTPDDFVDCASLASELMTFPGIPDDFQPEPPCSRCRQGDKRKKDPHKPDSAPVAKRPKLNCSVHGLCGHESKHCRVLNPLKDQNQGPKKSLKPKGMCYNEGCYEKFSPDHRDKCPFRNEKPDHSMNLMDLDATDTDQEKDLDMEDSDEEQGVPLFLMTTSDTQQPIGKPSPFIIVPCLIEGEELHAGLDSMASLSFMNPTLSSRFGPLEKVTGEIHMAVHGVRTPRLGRTRPLRVRVGTLSFVH